MLKALYAIVTVMFFVCVLFSFERPAMAYIDPGSGLFVFQSISSVGVGVLFFMRRRLRALFRRPTNDATMAGRKVAGNATEAPREYEIDKAA